MNSPLKEYLCPATGQPCAKGVDVFSRAVTARRWTSGTVKASTCTVKCAETWAQSLGYIITGASETYGQGTYTAEVTVQHPNQVSSTIKTTRSKS